jgi:threonyl-tRNA synthetase
MPKSNIIVTFPDGSTKEYLSGTSVLAIAKSISEGLAREAICGKVNSKLVDMEHQIKEDCTLQLLKYGDDEGRDVFQHSTTHLMACAIKKLFPDVKFGVGPAVKEGFYYDVDAKITEDDFPKIEEEMKKLVEQKVPCIRHEMKKEEALELFKNDPLKVEIINDKAKGEFISIYSIGDYYDPCLGPHTHHTGFLKAFKLMKVAGAYWKANQENQQLTRIYGVSFPDKKLLNKHLHFLEEASKRDHRKLGKQLDLFSFHEVSPGSPFFHPKGTIIYKELQEFLRSQHNKWGYQEVITPLIYNKELWEQSGHWKHYRENMFQLKMDHQEASLKPMNCPSHILIYKTQTRSYRDLPIRITDFAPLHRNELKGVLGGLTRVRKFSQDDCHVFCTQEQIKDEINKLIRNIKHVYSEIFNFEFTVELSTKPSKAMGDPKMWEEAEKALKQAIEENKLDYKINEGDGAFYGPKIDFHIKDSLGRMWQCATEQLDFQMPENFKVQYEGKDGGKHNVVMLHRTVLGSIERFMGILVEHFTGKFPAWLNPVQARVLTISEKFNDYAEEVASKMRKVGLRVETDTRTESVNRKVRESQLAQVNYSLVVGEREQKNNTITVRKRNNEVIGEIKVEKFISDLNKEIEDKTIL